MMMVSECFKHDDNCLLTVTGKNGQTQTIHAVSLRLLTHLITPGRHARENGAPAPLWSASVTGTCRMRIALMLW